jgi:hypothetical protein
MITKDHLIDWLLEGDISVAYQTHRDLLGTGAEELEKLRSRIEREGWGARLLSARRPDGHWGRGFYQPKWICTHYSLLDLKALGISPANRACTESTGMIFETCTCGADGGINYARTVPYSDVCINGMVLSLGCYFQLEKDLLQSTLDYLLRNRTPDGGWNCEYIKGAGHFSVHTTLAVLEGLAEYIAGGYTDRLGEVTAVIAAREELLLSHRLYRSHRTGRPMDPKMLMLSYPSRWRYDTLRALDYFRFAGRPYDPRMEDALAVLLSKRRQDGTWPLQAKHPGQVHFDMEQTGQPSRWNTLRALRVLNRCKNLS